VSTDEHRNAERMRALAGWSASAVHGLLGDHLAAHLGDRALGMGLYHRGRPLALDGVQIARAHPNYTSRLCVLVHGLGCTEGIWSFADAQRPGARTTYGELLHADLAYTPLYVRYNSGRSVAENGAALAELLAQLLAAYPGAVDEIVLIGHSMGGLVLRSACHADASGPAAWTPRVRRVFYLGTPHDGAHLERLVFVAAGVPR
jgi:triacylglycerol lipase